MANNSYDCISDNMSNVSNYTRADSVLGGSRELLFENETQDPNTSYSDFTMETKELTGANSDSETAESVDCCICYEKIAQDKNNCVTECGHRFCFKCLAMSMVHNNCTCPVCRNPLVDMPEGEDEDEDEDENDSEGMDDDEEGGEEDVDEEPECDIEELTRRVTESGIKMQDLLSMLLGRYAKDATDANIYAMDKKFDAIVLDADNEMAELAAMGEEDRTIFVM